MHNKLFVLRRIRLKGIVNLVCWRLAVNKVPRVNKSNKILLENVVDVLLLMNSKDVPVWLDAPAYSAHNHLAARMVWDPVRNVVHAVAAINPVRVGLAVVLVDLLKANVLAAIIWLLCKRCAGRA